MCYLETSFMLGEVDSHFAPSFFLAKTMSQIICPTCNETFAIHTTPAMPFCSVRCQQIDLGRWLNEEQGLPCEPEDIDEDEGIQEFSAN